MFSTQTCKKCLLVTILYRSCQFGKMLIEMGILGRADIFVYKYISKFSPMFFYLCDTVDLLNPLPEDNTLILSKFKALAEDKLNMVFGRVKTFLE